MCCRWRWCHLAVIPGSSVCGGLGGKICFFLFLSDLTWVLRDSGVLQYRPIMFPWGVKDAIRGVRNGFNRCGKVSLGQGIGIVQLFDFLQDIL
jgi:hypothetical protein